MRMVRVAGHRGNTGRVGWQTVGNLHCHNKGHDDCKWPKEWSILLQSVSSFVWVGRGLAASPEYLLFTHRRRLRLTKALAKARFGCEVPSSASQLSPLYRVVQTPRRWPGKRSSSAFERRQPAEDRDSTDVATSRLRAIKVDMACDAANLVVRTCQTVTTNSR